MAQKDEIGAVTSGPFRCEDHQDSSSPVRCFSSQKKRPAEGPLKRVALYRTTRTGLFIAGIGTGFHVNLTGVFDPDSRPLIHINEFH